MPDLSTPNFGWTLPTVGAASATWGASNNANWSSLDNTLHTGLLAISNMAAVIIAPNTVVVNATIAGGAGSFIGQRNGSNRWLIAMPDGETGTGANPGDNFFIGNFTDAGAAVSSTVPFEIVRATGQIYMNGGLNIATGGLQVAAASSFGSNLTVTGLGTFGGLTFPGFNPGHLIQFGFDGTSLRAKVDATDIGAIVTSTTAGAYLPISGGSITGNLSVGGTTSVAALHAAATTVSTLSASGTATVTGHLQANAGIDVAGSIGASAAINATGNITAGGNLTGQALFTVGPAASDADCTIVRASSSVDGALWFNHISPGAAGNRMAWFITNAEGSGNAGSDLRCVALDNGAAFLSLPIVIKRSTGVVSFSAAIVNGPSDRTLKENITPIEDALAKVNALQGVSFNMISSPEKREIGLIAQDVEPVVPEIMQTYEHHTPEIYKSKGRMAAEQKLALDYPKLTALLIEAVKTLTARVEALEAK